MLCDFALNQPHIAARRQELLSDVEGDVLEIGVGTGLNLAHYPQCVRQLTTIDPNPGINKRLRKRIQQSQLEVDQRTIGGEQLPFDDNRFDVVVTTFTLCSIADAATAVREIYRVLKPAGRYLLLEHGLCPDPKVQRWQKRPTPMQRVIAAGCRLDVDVRKNVADSPFSSIEITNYYLEHMPRAFGYAYQGAARK
jgi:ubiquinone/menaquinone biosynthesis C-methylase UbiE